MSKIMSVCHDVIIMCVIPCEINQISEKFLPDPHGFCRNFAKTKYRSGNENLKVLLSSYE